MSDINSILIEIHDILGNSSKVDEIQAGETTPADAARMHLREGMALVDEVVLEAISKLEWESIAEMAALAVLPATEIVFMARSLREGTSSFREAWRSLNERYEMPFVLSRGGFIMASNISPDEDVVKRIVNWSKVVLGEASERTKKAVSKKHPASAYVPGDNKKKTSKAFDDTKAYMTPHQAETDKPDAKKKVLDTRQLDKSGSNEKKARKKDLAAVEKDIKKLEAVAKKAGRKPEEMFPMMYRDLMREKVRAS